MALLTPDWVMPSSVAARTKERRSATLTKIASARRSGMAYPSPTVMNDITTGPIIRKRPKPYVDFWVHGAPERRSHHDRPNHAERGDARFAAYVPPLRQAGPPDCGGALHRGGDRGSRLHRARVA